MGDQEEQGFSSQAEDASSVDPSDVASLSEYWEIVKAALTSKQFAVVALYFRESLTQEDIAERLSISQQSVEESLRRAIARLKKSPACEMLDRCIPAAKRKPKGHHALHAYEVAQTRNANRIEEEYGADSPEEIREMERNETLVICGVDDDEDDDVPAHQSIDRARRDRAVA